MTEKSIQKALLNAFTSHKYKFTNVYYFNNESYWLSWLDSGFCYECEIKNKTQKEISIELGIDQSTISRLLKR